MITPERMAEIRSAELKSVGAVVKADEIVQWDYHDQGLVKVDPKELSSRILDFINRSGAEVVIGYGPDGVSGHVDHVVGCQRVLEAFKSSHAQKLYYVNVPKAVYPVYYLSRQILYIYNPKWFPGKDKPLPTTVKVDIRCYRKMKLLSLDEHASQKFFMTAIDRL
jgi:LmbE family N-acetylglucosaminyl deacetylase